MLDLRLRALRLSGQVHEWDGQRGMYASKRSLDCSFLMKNVGFARLSRWLMSLDLPRTERIVPPLWTEPGAPKDVTIGLSLYVDQKIYTV